MTSKPAGRDEREKRDAPDARGMAAGAEAALDAASRAVDVIAGAQGSRLSDGPDGERDHGPDPSIESGIEMLGDVDLRVTVELGRTRMLVEDVLRLGPDSVVELDKAAGDPVDIYVNDRHVARGEVLVVDENFCIRVSEIVQPRAGTG